MDNVIKVLLKSTCPHCQKEILIEVESPTPVIKGILTGSDISVAKNYVVEKLNALLKDGVVDKKDVDDATEWVLSEETVFGPGDAESIIESVKNSK